MARTNAIPPHETDRLLALTQPPRRRKNVMWTVCSYILWLETIEAVAFYGIAQALKNFMEARLGYSKVSASAVRSTWTSLYNIMPLLGAYIGDERWGRYTSIKFFAMWYIAATSLLTFAAHPTVLEHHLPLSNACFLVSLFLGVAVGHGCMNPNIVTLGADQFHADDDAQKQLFFSYFYLAINLGSSVSYGYLAYLSVNGLGDLVPPSYGYFATFLLSTVLLIAALLLFVGHSSKYITLPPHPDAFTALFTTLASGISMCPELRFIVGGFVLFLVSFALNAMVVFSTESSAMITYAAGLCVFLGMGCWIAKGMDPSYLDALEHAMPSSSLLTTSVDEFKQVVRVLPFACFLVLWQSVFDQIDANFQSIAQQCDLRLGSARDAPQIPGAMLGLFDTIGVSIMIPALEFAVFPLLRRIRGGVAASPFEKVFCGLLLAGLAMLWTGVVETWRRDSGAIDLGDGQGPVLDLGTHKPMNNLSWVYVVPNYLLVCCCECLVNVTMYDVFYSNVPLHWKSTAQAINSFMLAMGDNMASIVTLVFAAYIPDDLNQGHLEYMYYTMAAVSVANAVGFFAVMTRMKFATGHDDPGRKVVKQVEA
ncbi:Aste57867_10232 [Aphanomyces stellatus]|uniref:Aste57867_10232 protein n=1 Tax=Aphanomyces stellatus TaxID=120398 RepID=A0A485KQU4_9STRA|nr:hypothetical protein As57867_010193 [Aphanomyces stellatus]VFT87107.1 Aste57867_10232 [Aphanomyces stellatus]